MARLSAARLGSAMVVCVVVGCGLGALARADSSGVAKSAITSVTFSGAHTPRPVIDVRGTGFGLRPAHDPSYRPTPPQGNTLPYGCTATGNVGWDYGTQLWISFKSPGLPLWSAGRYRPALQELDCVGIVLVSYSPTHIRFRFGSGYRTFHFALKPGDRFTMSVKGAAKPGAVP